MDGGRWSRVEVTKFEIQSKALGSVLVRRIFTAQLSLSLSHSETFEKFQAFTLNYTLRCVK